MRIDTHQHFWRYDADEYAWIDDSLAPLRRDYLPEDAWRAMREASFDAAIAVQARQTLEETHWLLALARVYPWIVGVIGWVDLQSPAVAQVLDTLAGASRLLGVRHIVQSEPDDFLSRPAFHRGVALLASRGLTYDVLVYERQLPAAIEFITRFPDQGFVLDHLGKPEIRGGRFDAWARQMKALAGHQNVTCKLSGLVTESDWTSWTPEALRPYIDTAVEYFGPDRLMIGSDWPVCTVAGSYGRTMAVVTDAMADWPTFAREAVLGGTAARVWHLPRPEPSL